MEYESLTASQLGARRDSECKAHISTTPLILLMMKSQVSGTKE